MEFLIMSWRPETFCKLCDEPFEVYMAPEERVCDECREAAPDVSPRLSFYATHNRTVEQDGSVREDLAHWRRKDIERGFDPASFIPKPLDDEPQEPDPAGDGYDKKRQEYEEMFPAGTLML